jgi:hypothetical protein
MSCIVQEVCEDDIEKFKVYIEARRIFVFVAYEKFKISF